MSTPSVRVAIVSSQPLIHAGLSRMVTGSPHLVEAVRNASGVVDADAVLYDTTDLPRPDFELDYLACLPHAALVAVVPPDRPRLNGHALARGAAAVVSYAVTARGLSDAVQHATQAHRRRDRAITSVAYPEGLSRREVQVLTRVALARSNGQIAAELHLSGNSIKTYIRTAYRKIGVDSRSKAALWTIQRYEVDAETVPS